MARPPTFVDPNDDSIDEAGRASDLIAAALQDPLERRRYDDGSYRPLDPRSGRGIPAFKTVAKAYGQNFAPPERRPRAEVANLLQLHRTLLLERTYAPFLALPSETIFFRIGVLRYVHVAIHEAPELLLIAFEQQPKSRLRRRRNELEAARQAETLTEPWSPDDVRAWTADEQEFRRHLARTAAQARMPARPKARSNAAGAADHDDTPSTENAETEKPPMFAATKKGAERKPGAKKDLQGESLAGTANAPRPLRRRGRPPNIRG